MRNNNFRLETNLLNQRINYTLNNWIHNHQQTNNLHKSNISSISREDLNSKFKGENFILQNNENINKFLMNEKKSVIITTKRPNKNSVIISAHHKHNHIFDRNPFDFLSHDTYLSPSLNRSDLTNSVNPGSNVTHYNDFNVEQTSAATTTTTIHTTTTNKNIYSSTTKPNDENWSIYEFLKNVIKLG